MQSLVVISSFHRQFIFVEPEVAASSDVGDHPSNWFTVISLVTCASLRIFINVSLWASKLKSKNKMEILEGVCPN
jgi:hypothetical protein